MRNNNRTYSFIKNVTNETPLHDKLTRALKENSSVTVSGIIYKVVDASPIKGTTSTEFFLNKIW